MNFTMAHFQISEEIDMIVIKKWKKKEAARVKSYGKRKARTLHEKDKLIKRLRMALYRNLEKNRILEKKLANFAIEEEVIINLKRLLDDERNQDPRATILMDQVSD